MKLKADAVEVTALTVEMGRKKHTQKQKVYCMHYTLRRQYQKIKLDTVLENKIPFSNKLFLILNNSMKPLDEPESVMSRSRFNTDFLQQLHI